MRMNFVWIFHFNSIEFRFRFHIPRLKPKEAWKQFLRIWIWINRWKRSNEIDLFEQQIWVFISNYIDDDWETIRSQMMNWPEHCVQSTSQPNIQFKTNGKYFRMPAKVICKCNQFPEMDFPAAEFSIYVNCHCIYYLFTWSHPNDAIQSVDGSGWRCVTSKS